MFLSKWPFQCSLFHKSHPMSPQNISIGWSRFAFKTACCWKTSVTESTWAWSGAGTFKRRRGLVLRRTIFVWVFPTLYPLTLGQKYAGGAKLQSRSCQSLCTELSLRTLTSHLRQTCIQYRNDILLFRPLKELRLILSGAGYYLSVLGLVDKPLRRLARFISGLYFVILLS